MRNIKFRAWNIENKEMLDVQELDYQDNYNGQPMVRTTMYNDYFDTEDMILMQYTGLKDKNGKEIYEGDIIQYEDITKGLVRYSEKYAQYVLVNTSSVKDEFEPLGDYNMRVFEIIGNEFDNPDLLEEKE